MFRIVFQIKILRGEKWLFNFWFGKYRVNQIKRLLGNLDKDLRDNTLADDVKLDISALQIIFEQ